jgi:hypothetical protein
VNALKFALVAVVASIPVAMHAQAANPPGVGKLQLGLKSVVIDRDDRESFLGLAWGTRLASTKRGKSKK